MPINTLSADRVWYDWHGNRHILPPCTIDRQERLVGPYGWVCRAKQRMPCLGNLKAGSAVAIDCEGVILDDEKDIKKKGCGRFSVVAEDGTVIYDTFVHYPANVAHRPPPQRVKLGVKYPDILHYNGAQPIAEVLRAADEIFKKAGVIVGHAIENEMHMLRDVKWDDLQSKIRDTQLLEEYRRYNDGRPVKLDVLTAELLGQPGLQAQGHSSVKDARATMKLYLLRRDAIDRNHSPSLYDWSQWSVCNVEGDPRDTSSSDGFGGWWSELVESGSSHTSLSAAEGPPLMTNSNKSPPAAEVATATSTDRSEDRNRSQIVRVALPNLPSLARRAAGKRWDPRSSRYI